MALSESPIHLIAPKKLASSKNRPRYLLSFLIISSILYLSASIIFYFFWDLINTNSLNFNWVISYMIFFLPTILMTSWFTCWIINFKYAFIIIFFRYVSLLFIIYFESLFYLFLSSSLYLILIIIFLFYIKSKKEIKNPTLEIIKKSLYDLKIIFTSKSFSYLSFSITPIILSVSYSNEISSLYVAGERLKNFFTTLFTPIIQFFYLSFSKNLKLNNNIIVAILFSINIIFLIFLLFVVKLNFFKQFNIFSQVSEIELYIFSAFFSVASAIISYLIIIQHKLYSIYTDSLNFQTIVILILLILIYFYAVITPSQFIFIIELVFLISLFFCLLIKRNLLCK